MSANNDKVLSLRELCQKATKGPWRWIGTNKRPTAKAYLQGANYATVLADVEGLEIKESDAQLIARCSPETMLRVEELIQTLRHNISPAHPNFKSIYAECEAVLAALDGKETP